MTQTEIEEAMTKLCDLWPAWKPNDQEAQTWRRQFGKYASLAIVLAGLESAWKGNVFNTPKPRDIFASISAEAARPGQQGLQANDELMDTGLVTLGINPAGRRACVRVLLYPHDPRMATMDGRYQAAQVQVEALSKMYHTPFEAMTQEEAQKLRDHPTLTSVQPGQPQPAQPRLPQGSDPVILAELLKEGPLWQGARDENQVD